MKENINSFIETENGKTIPIKLTKIQKADKKRLKENFLKYVDEYEMIERPNGFFAVGRLKQPTDPVVKKVNKYFFVVTGFNQEGNRIEYLAHFGVAGDELEYIVECVTNFLKRINTL